MIASTDATNPEPDLKALFLAQLPSAVLLPLDEPEALLDAVEVRRNQEKPANSSADENKGRGAEVCIPLLNDCPLYLDDSGASYILFNERLCLLDCKNKELAEDIGYFYKEKTGKVLSREHAEKEAIRTKSKYIWDDHTTKGD